MEDNMGHETVGDIWTKDDHCRVIVMCLCGWTYDSGWLKEKTISHCFDVEDEAYRHRIHADKEL